MVPRGRGGGEDPTSVETHFRFGENWRDFVESQVSAERIEDAKARFRRLFMPEEIRSKRFIDIGCGSGLSMLCALENDPAVAAGVDTDPSSVEAAKALLSRYAQGLSWSVTQRSIFDPVLHASGRYDVVHSWGVLHHTGNM